MVLSPYMRVWRPERKRMWQWGLATFGIGTFSMDVDPTQDHLVWLFTNQMDAEAFRLTWLEHTLGLFVVAGNEVLGSNHVG